MKKKSAQVILCIFLSILTASCSTDLSSSSGSDNIEAISLSIKTNRTEGIAPLSVSFDLTDSVFNDEDTLMLAEFMWNFGDDGDDYNIGKGYCPAHVYREAGSYTATVTAYYNGIEKQTVSVDITVSEFTGTTYYISADGSDSNDGLSEETAFATPEYAIENYMAPSTRFLLRQGDTFIKSEQITIGAYDGITIEGPVIISSYEDSSSPSEEKPIIYDSRVNDGFTANLAMLNCDDFRVINLYFMGAGEV